MIIIAGICWTDPNNKTPCFPDYNNLEYYILRSRVSGIHEAYQKASEEISVCYNDLNDRNRHLIKEIERLTKAANSASVHNEKLETISQKLTLKPPLIMNGRKPKLLNNTQVQKAKRMYQDGFSYASIAAAFGVSDRTIRRAIKESTRNEKDTD